MEIFDSEYLLIVSFLEGFNIGSLLDAIGLKSLEMVGKLFRGKGCIQRDPRRGDSHIRTDVVDKGFNGSETIIGESEGDPDSPGEPPDPVGSYGPNGPKGKIQLIDHLFSPQELLCDSPKGYWVELTTTSWHVQYGRSSGRRYY